MSSIDFGRMLVDLLAVLMLFATKFSCKSSEDEVAVERIRREDNEARGQNPQHIKLRESHVLGDIDAHFSGLVLAKET